MSILDEWIVFDTNIWIFGLRRVPDNLPCAELLEHLARLRVVLPRQVLQELHANLSEDEIRVLFRLLTRFPERLKIDWEKTKPEIIAKYQRLGCKLGDAVVAAHLEELEIKILVSENRDFLEEVRELPFRRLSAAQALAELEQSKK
ncbi:MAG: type II toxin-antitoxin system VapC family toxin [Deltaproteobacteria bacterium]|nr:type II toxin-antitoxin system VapC family toxin [Deltaproteobacteria bacterium]